MPRLCYRIPVASPSPPRSCTPQAACPPRSTFSPCAQVGIVTAWDALSHDDKRVLTEEMARTGIADQAYKRSAVAR